MANITIHVHRSEIADREGQFKAPIFLAKAGLGGGLPFAPYRTRVFQQAGNLWSI
jgi:hypothetical protein